MKLFTKLLAGAALAAATAAQAATINVGGVVWNPDEPFLDFSGTSATISQFIDPVSGDLSGFGVIATLNGKPASVFCPGCELTFQYGGYQPTSFGDVPNPAGDGTAINYKGGFVKVFVDHTPNADPSNPLALNAGNAADGALWLDLVGHAVNGVTLTGFNFFPEQLLGKGLWDVIGGLAKGNMDTNTKTDGADLSFTNSFTTFPTPSPLISYGTGNFKGNSIPEPGSLLLLSLGLLAVASTRARKNS